MQSLLVAYELPSVIVVDLREGAQDRIDGSERISPLQSEKLWTRARSTIGMWERPHEPWGFPDLPYTRGSDARGFPCVR